MAFRGGLPSRAPGAGRSRDRSGNLGVNTTIANQAARFNVQATAFNPANSANRYLAHNSVPDLPDTPLIVSSDGAAERARASASGSTNVLAREFPAPIGTNKGLSPTRTDDIYTTDIAPGKFVGGHYMKLTISAGSYEMIVAEALKHEGNLQNSIRSYFVMPKAEGTRLNIFVCFDSVRVADEVPHKISLIDSTADIKFVTQPEYAAAQKELELSGTGARPVGKTSGYYDGQVMFLAFYDGPMSASKPDHLAELVRKTAAEHGKILAFGEMSTTNGVARFRVEYQSIKAAKEVVRTVPVECPKNVNGWMVYTEEFGDVVSVPASDTGAAGRGTPADTRGETPQFISPTGRTGWSVDQTTGETVAVTNTGARRVSPFRHSQLAIMPARHVAGPMTMGPMTMPASYGHRPRYGPMAASMQSFGHQLHPYPHAFEAFANKHDDQNQAVSAVRITQGLDVRTTIMARNLPKAMTCHIMKDILDSSSYGEYDFSYVRIDYGTRSAVGYGFINFSTPDSIIRFMEAHVGRPWNHPDLPAGGKEAAISYATVQGLDCCIEKFRNSSVMTECPDYRPKLWYSKDNAPEDSVVGQEMVFPGVNNESKHARSLANASTIGLFEPQSRRVPGGRAGRSQFDRGTTAQQQEDAAFYLQTQMQQMSLPPTPQYNHNMQYGMFPPMPPMPPTPGHYGAMVPYNPQFGQPSPMMPPHGFYPAPHMSMPPPMQHGFQNGPVFANGNGFGPGPNYNHGNGHMQGGPQFANGPNHGFSHGRNPNNNPHNRRTAVPRAFDQEIVEERAGNFQGDVDMRGLTGYTNPLNRSNGQQ